MKGIEFEQETYHPLSVATETKKKSFFIRIVYKLGGGRVKTDAQASLILFIIAIILLALSFYNFFFIGRTSVPKRSNPNEIKAMNQQLRR